jgi:hypothetical protein
MTIVWTCHCGSGPMVLAIHPKCIGCQHEFVEGCCSYEDVKDSEGAPSKGGSHGSQDDTSFVDVRARIQAPISLLFGSSELGLTRMPSQSAYRFQPAPDVHNIMPSSNSMPASDDSPADGETVWRCCQCDGSSTMLVAVTTNCDNCDHDKCENCKSEAVHSTTEVS